MGITRTLSDYLATANVSYRLIHHRHTGSSMDSAAEAHIPAEALAKAVVVREGMQYTLVVLPADMQVDVASLRRLLGRDVHLAAQAELREFFPDCDLGAIPALGMAYYVPTIWDAGSSLGQLDEVYFEAGDHENLVAVSGESFHELMATAERGEFSD
ncbi:MAG: aminoacyl-tRNA deacylase [Pontibacterium sp.]